MSTTDKGSWQDSVKNRHKEGVIALLQEQNSKAMRFMDILAQKDRTGIKSPKGLTAVLQRLIVEGLIEKTFIDIELEKGKPVRGSQGKILEKNVMKKKVEAYSLTTTGQGYMSWWLIHELLELKDKKVGYFHSASANYYGFGLSEDFVHRASSNNKLPNIDIASIPDMEDFFMSKIFKEIREKGIKVEPNDEKIILSFELDFAELTSQLIVIQMFMDDLNSGKDVFLDDRLFLKEASNYLWRLDMFARYSFLMGDDKFRSILKKVLKKFTSDPRFHEIANVDVKLFHKFLKCINEGENPLNDRILFKNLIVPIEKGIGYYNVFKRYVIAAKILNFGDDDFEITLDQIDAKVGETISKMSMEWANKEQKKLEDKQKGDKK